MKNYNFLFIILLGITLTNCGDTKKSANSIFAFDNSKFKEHYQPQDAVSLEISNPNAKTIDSITYFVNDIKVGSKKGLEKLNFELKDQKLGYQNLKAIVYYEGNNSEAESRIELVSNVTPKLLKYKILNKYPHDNMSFTEGLEFIKDTLYESTGNPDGRKSYLRKYDYKTGKVYKQIDLDPQYFGEGITMINNKIYQLTWQSNVGFIYDLNTLKKIKTFKFDKEIEGWGLTNDGKYIYQTDKTEKIWKMDPETQKMIGYINVYSGDSKIKSVNELEWINGKIYTNVWLKDAIAVVNPSSGAVEGILDLSGLKKLVKNADADVLNGIAYNPKTKTIFVTGKNWDTLFEIAVFE